MLGRFSDSSSLVRRGLGHCGLGPIGKGIGLVSPLLFWSAWGLTLFCLADRQELCSGLALVPYVGVGLVTVVAGRQAMSLVRFRFSFFAGVGLVTVVAGRQARALVWYRLC